MGNYPPILLKEDLTMLEVYSLNVTVPADSPVPFNNVSIQKGCTAKLNGVSTIELNKCGVYMVECDASASATTTLQLFKNGVAQPQAQSTGGTPAFTTLVQVTENNCGCPCSSPTNLQIRNTADAEATLTNVNVVVTKLV